MLAAMTAPGPAWRLQVGLSLSAAECCALENGGLINTTRTSGGILKRQCTYFSAAAFYGAVWAIAFRTTRVFRNTFPTKRDPETRATGLERAPEGGEGVCMGSITRVSPPTSNDRTIALLYYFGPTRGEMKQINNCCSRTEFETEIYPKLL